MPKRIQKNARFGPKELLGDFAVDFVAKWPHEGPDAETRKAVALPLVRLALYPQEMTDAETATWFPRFYAEHPRFAVETLAAIQAKARQLSPAEHYLRSFGHLAEARPVSDKDRARKVEKLTGSRVSVRSFETARGKIQELDSQK